MLIVQGLAVLAIAGLDQLVKSWAGQLIASGGQAGLPGLFRVVYAENDGAAFSMLPGMRSFFLPLTVAALILIVWLLVRRWPRHWLGSWALTLLAGGAVGNFIDRVIHGYVVDMFEFEFVRFAIFNVADIFVTAGGLLFCVYLLFLHERKKNKESHASASL